MKKRKLKVKNLFILFIIVIIFIFLISFILNKNNNTLEGIGYNNLEIEELEKLSDEDILKLLEEIE